MHGYSLALRYRWAAKGMSRVCKDNQWFIECCPSNGLQPRHLAQPLEHEQGDARVGAQAHPGGQPAAPQRQHTLPPHNLRHIGGRERGGGAGRLDSSEECGS